MDNLLKTIFNEWIFKSYNRKIKFVINYVYIFRMFNNIYINEFLYISNLKIIFLIL